MGNLKDLTGKIFGRWKVLELDKEKTKKTGRTYYICECSCPKHTKRSVRADGLGIRSFSCGCLQKEKVANYCKENYKKYNKYDLSGEYGIGYTTKGEEFYFNIEDYNKIKDYCWYVNNVGYLAARNSEINSPILMHRLVMNCQNSTDVVDHIGHNIIDNRKANLRICTQGENSRNHKISILNTSGQTGVTYDKNRNKWCASIVKDGVTKYLGRFNSYEDAVNKRKEAENIYFGEYSYNNSINIYKGDG